MKSEMMALTTSHERVLSFVKEIYFQPAVFEKYAPRYCEGQNLDLVYTEFQLFLESDLVTQNFSSYWTKETGSQWPGRTVETAVTETVNHAFILLHRAAQDYHEVSSAKEILGEMTEDEVKKIEKYSKLAVVIFRDVEMDAAAEKQSNTSASVIPEESGRV